MLGHFQEIQGAETTLGRMKSMKETSRQLGLLHITRENSGPLGSIHYHNGAIRIMKKSPEKNERTLRISRSNETTRVFSAHQRKLRDTRRH